MRVMRPAVLMCLAMMATACGSDSDSPTQPTNVPPVAGTWRGTYQVRTCTEPPLLPVGASVCSSLIAPPGTTGTPQPVQFTLAQNETVLSGTITFGGWLGSGTQAPAPAPVTGVTVPLTGLVDRGGTILLQASQNTNDPACPNATIRTVLTTLNATVNRDRNGMQLGTFQLTTSRRVGTTGCNYYEVAISADQLTVALPGGATGGPAAAR